MRHVTVFGERGVFAGWPANHGAWQWDDEFLVGFIRGKYNVGGMHNVVGKLEKVHARSLDGGETWSIEKPTLDFEAHRTIAPPMFALGGDTIIRVCGRYDHGGERCAQRGGFYLSQDRGRNWRGAYEFSGLADVLTDRRNNTSRTRHIGDLIFMSANQRNHWGSDFIFVARHDGRSFEEVGTVVNDSSRAVMPAVADLRGRLVVTARRRGAPRVEGWVDSFVSDDAGETWSQGRHVGETGSDNGNPPALIATQGRVYCAFGNRSECRIDVMISDDGERWLPHAMLRKGANSDIGYPQLFKRADGRLVCVYYWADDEGDHQHIEATTFDP